MGIKRLFTFFKSNFEEKELRSISGKTLGIDGMNWLYQAFFSVCDMIDSIHVPIIRKLEYRFKLLQKHNINFVVVIDGKSLKCKSVALRKRKEKREYYMKQAKKYEDEEDFGQLAVYQKYSQEVTPELVFFFIDYLKFKGFKYVVAPYEADSQLAYMLRQGEIDYISSEDSDFLAMNCFKLIRGIRKEGKCLVFNEEINGSKKKEVTFWDKFLSLPRERRTMLCVMTGCDYIENLRGVGFITLIDIFYRFKDEKEKHFEEELIRILSARRGNAEVVEHIKEVKKICCSFTNQVVYNTKQKQVVHANPLDKKLGDMEEFVGSLFEDAERFAKGDLHFESHLPRGPLDLSIERCVNFVNFVAEDKGGRLNNLCQVPFGFESFNRPIIVAPDPQETIRRIIKPTRPTFRRSSFCEKRTIGGSLTTRSVSRSRLTDDSKPLSLKRAKLI